MTVFSKISMKNQRINMSKGQFTHSFEVEMDKVDNRRRLMLSLLRVAHSLVGVVPSNKTKGTRINKKKAKEQRNKRIEASLFRQ